MTFSNLYAHTLAGRREDEWEPLAKHLEEVAAGTADNAAAFGAADWGRTLGACHDLGKASDEFQQYLRLPDRNEAEEAGLEQEVSARRVDHSTFGARYVAKCIGSWEGRVLAFCIAGHHSGLANDVPDDSGNERATLRGRLDPAQPIPRVDDPIDPPTKPQLPWKIGSREQVAWSLSFFTRMLFSCLIDADRTCTEAFCDPEIASERQFPRPTLCELESTLTSYLDELTARAQPSLVNQYRQNILNECRAAAGLSPGFFSLQVPTGGGKTLSSLAFALRHAKDQPGIRRVIVAIPFTSIIEQTADVYRRALGALAERALVEHHTNILATRDTRSNQLGTENWDAPLIVTTNVQLLEILFASATTPCRKLHRIAGSVIVLDEAQTLPVDLLAPTLAALRELVEHYGCSVVLCTATQPALEYRTDFPIGLVGVRPIITNPAPLFAALKRVEVRRAGKLSDEELTGRLAEESQVLCIVNTRLHAARLYERLSLQAPGSCFHLSTLMCGAHRRIALQTIRERVESQQPCRVISTQLIEAGVDLDFPVVYRASSGFDSIAQAAGRCNREGRLARGITYVFDAEQEPPPGLLREWAQCARELFSLWPDPLAPAAIRAYFELAYWKRRDRWDAKRILSMLTVDRRSGDTRFQFREVEAAYRIIDDRQLPILIPFDSLAEEFTRYLIVDELHFISQRKLQPYLVSVPERALRGLETAGMVLSHDSGVHLLLRQDAYTQATGLRIESQGLDARLWGV